ncbi:uncharacterized protein BDW70DRAFT_157804 [Aspergillus foveolatus]|uniref:uncharacterized protein n=1 Tax=Aspergillus foveolatus TaxID=210207 RepID=UPI003CCC9ABD
MPFSIYSAGFIAALTGLAQALPTATTPSIGDLTSASTSTTGSPSGSSFIGFAGSNELDLGDAEELPELSSSIIAGSLQHLNNANDERDNSDSNSNSGLSSGSSFMGFAGSSDLDLGDSEELPEFDSSFLLGSLQNLESNDREARSDSGPIPTSGTSFIGAAGSNDLDLGDADELPENESSLLLGSLQTSNQDEEDN